MRLIIEETNEQTENKRRSVVECESDTVPVDETIDMVVRCLLSYGYNREAIGYFLVELTKDNPAPSTEDKEQDE